MNSALAKNGYIENAAEFIGIMSLFQEWVRERTLGASVAQG
jgi:hypothetical protein